MSFLKIMALLTLLCAILSYACYFRGKGEWYSGEGCLFVTTSLIFRELAKRKTA